MKLTTYLITILAVIGSYTALQGAGCTDGRAQCNDGTIVNWSCVFRFGCVARDYKNSDAAAEALCANHGGVNRVAVDPKTMVQVYEPCFNWE